MWSELRKQAFTTLKNKLCSYPVLILPDETQLFHIYFNGSKRAIAFVLMQKREGKLHPIAYDSCALDKHQQNWPITCLEAFALVMAVHHFKFYIQGNKSIVHTDHSALTYIAKQHLQDSNVARWLQTLLQYAIQIQYEKRHKQYCGRCFK